MAKQYVFIAKEQYVSLEELEEAIDKVFKKFSIRNDYKKGEFLDSIHRFGFYQFFGCYGDEDLDQQIIKEFQKYGVYASAKPFKGFKEDEDYETLEWRSNIDNYTAILAGKMYFPEWASLIMHSRYSLVLEGDITPKVISDIKKFYKEQNIPTKLNNNLIDDCLSHFGKLVIYSSDDWNELDDLKHELKIKFNIKNEIIDWKENRDYLLILDEEINESIFWFYKRYITFKGNTDTLESIKNQIKKEGYFVIYCSSDEYDLIDTINTLPFKTRVIQRNKDGTIIDEKNIISSSSSNKKN